MVRTVLKQAISGLVAWLAVLPALANYEIALDMYDPVPWAVLNPAHVEFTDVHAAQNLPAAREQGAFGICSGCAAAMLVQHRICNPTEPGRARLDCSQLRKDQQVSIMHMQSKVQPITKQDEIGEEWSHRGLPLTPGARARTYGSTLKVALYAMGQGAKDIYSEACYDFSRVAGAQLRLATPTGGVMRDLELIETAFEAKVLARAEDGRPCVVCDRLNRLFALDLSQQQMARLAREYSDDFATFLYASLFSATECMPMRNVPRIRLSYFPKDNRTAARDEVLDFIRNHFRDAAAPIPLGISNLCLLRRKSAELLPRPATVADVECWHHELVLTGYRLACLPGGQDCRPEIRVLNCWGEDWQRAHRGGWLDARKLLDAMDIDAPRIAFARLSWIQP